MAHPMSYHPIGSAWASITDPSANADLDAIALYMGQEVAKTDAARKIQDEFKVWFDGLSWYEKSDRPNLDRARNLRDAFQRANATTPAEVAAVQRVQETGLTLEETMGQPKRKTSEGYSEKEGETVPPLPAWTKWAIGGAIGIGVLYALGKITTLAEIFAGKHKRAAPDHTSNPGRRRRRTRR